MARNFKQYRTVTAELASVLKGYARETAADIDGDFAAAVRAMRDDALEVALNVGCPVTLVVDWCAAQGEVRS